MSDEQGMPVYGIAGSVDKDGKFRLTGVNIVGWDVGGDAGAGRDRSVAVEWDPRTQQVVGIRELPREETEDG